MQSSPRGKSDESEPSDIEQKLEEYWSRLTGFLFSQKTLLALVLLVFIATRLWLLLAFRVDGEDTQRYSLLARQGVDLQQVAFRDVLVEYPPVAWWLITVPRLIDSRSYTDPDAPPEIVYQFYAWYYNWFHAEMLLIDLVCVVLMYVIGRRMLPKAAWVLPGVYTLLTIAQPHLAYDRLDLGLLMFFLLFIACWLRSLDAAPASNGWAVASYLFLGLGISFKIMPVIFVPYLLLADFWAAGSARRLVWRVAALMLSAVGPFLVQFCSAGMSVFLLFRFHGERGIHLESIWGSMLLVGAAVGVPCHIVRSHGGFNLEGDWSDVLKILSGECMLTAAALFGLWAFRQGRRFDRRLALDAAILVLINSTTLAHVFSPQYLNWLLPLALLLALNTFPRNAFLWCGFAALTVAIVGISSWLFPDHYIGEITEFQTWPLVISVIRNVCLAALTLLLNGCFFAKYGLVRWRAESGAPGPVAVTA